MSKWQQIFTVTDLLLQKQSAAYEFSQNSFSAFQRIPPKYILLSIFSSKVSDLEAATLLEKPSTINDFQRISKILIPAISKNSSENFKDNQ